MRFKVAILAVGAALLIGLGILSLCFFSQAGELSDGKGPPASPEVEKEMREAIVKTCAEINEFYRSEGYHDFVLSPEETIFLYDTNRSMGHRNVRFSRIKGDGGFYGSIAEDSHRIGYFANGNPQASGWDGDPADAEWTQEKIVSEAFKFSQIFAKGWGERRWAKPVVTRESGRRWKVGWTEISPAGLEGLGSGIEITVSQGFGPYEARVNLGPQPLKDLGIKPITKEAALDKAWKATRWAKWWGDASLNDGEIKKDVYTTQFGLSTDSKPIWQITYKFYPSRPYLRGDIIVGIDAETGNILWVVGPLAVA